MHALSRLQLTFAVAWRKQRIPQLAIASLVREPAAVPETFFSVRASVQTRGQSSDAEPRGKSNSSISYGIQSITEYKNLHKNILRQSTAGISGDWLKNRHRERGPAARFAGTDRFSLGICVRGDWRNQFALDVP